MAAKQIRSFGDAARVAAEQEDEHQEPVWVEVLGREIEIEYPGTGQVVFMTAELSDFKDDMSQIGGLMHFLYKLVTPEDARYIREKLLDRNSGFDALEITEMFEYLIEEWSSRPTTSASSSSPSPRTTGTSSTGGARKRASSPSRSRSAGS